MKIYSNILELIGKTPLVRLNNLTKNCCADLVLKAEFFNPASSIKDRTALSMITAAEKSGIISDGAVIIEPTSGNTGIALAMICAIKKYRLIITMPESVSLERRKLIAQFGADIILTPAKDGMKGAIEKAEKIHAQTENSFIPMQFDNESNPAIHYEMTAEEIWKDTDGKVDIVVAGVGTGGTISGIAKKLKEKKSSVKIVAVEPEESAVLSGGSSGLHGIQGIGAGFVPEIMDLTLIDEIIPVKTKDAVETAKELTKQEGILCGISSGAALKAGLDIASRIENKNKLVVVIAPDTAERYLSTPLFE